MFPGVLKLKKPTHVAKRERNALPSSFTFCQVSNKGFKSSLKEIKRIKRRGYSVIHAENIHTRARQNAAHV